MDKKNKIWSNAMKIGSIAGCHQMSERSLFIKNYQFPVCARCTGVIIGQSLSVILYALNIKLSIFVSIASILSIAIDGGLQYFNYLKSNNFRRVVTGILGGFGFFNLIIWAISYTFKAINHILKFILQPKKD